MPSKVTFTGSGDGDVDMFGGPSLEASGPASLSRSLHPSPSAGCLTVDSSHRISLVST